jgi:hypothetical protein
MGDRELSAIPIVFGQAEQQHNHQSVANAL